MITDHKTKKVILTRRSVLKGAGLAGAGAALGGAGALGTLANLATPQSAEAQTTFYKGCDISWLPQMEANGYKFYTTAGVQTDAITILKSYGMTAVRIRFWVNPSTDPVRGHCTTAEMAAFASRCRTAGLQFMVDLHYGDTWNDVGTQNPPAAWASYTYAQMKTAIYNYTLGVMTALKNIHATPLWVQIGNEINSGLCHPIGTVSNPAQMTGCLNSGYDAVKAIFPNAQCIIHLAQPQNGTAINTMLGGFVANGGKWDILGFSSYGDKTVAASLAATMIAFGQQYGKPIMQVEVGGKVSKGADTAAAVTAYIQGVRNGGGLGVFYWEPEVYSPFDVYDMGACGTNGKFSPTIMGAFLAA
jgi:arabinogalactan endo-1,4-beta-galactosidase